jgi:uncharacterized protein YbjT (DUF2867 family)
MADDRIVLVTGATGKQGGATLRHLAKAGGFKLRGMTRNPTSDAARALADLGVELVKGDLEDNTSLTNALSGAWGVFGVLDITGQGGVVKEEAQGKRLVAVARERGVQQFVYSSVGSAHKRTGIPHFESKARIEDALRQAGFPSFTILRPVFFMENLPSPWFLHGDKLISALNPSTKVQMIAVDDVGRFGASAFVEQKTWNRAEIDIAGEAASMLQAATVLSTMLGREISYEAIPMDAVRKNSEDLALMLEWFEKVGYSADIANLELKWGIRPMTLEQWATTQKA